MPRVKDWTAYQPSDPDEMPPFWGSSVGFEVTIGRDFPHLAVPEHAIIPLVADPEWDTDHEVRPHRGQKCSNCGGRVRSGSLLYCPKCHKSGFDAQLYEQRGLSGFPPREPPPAPIPLPAPRTRRERRRLKFATGS